MHDGACAGDQRKVERLTQFGNLFKADRILPVIGGGHQKMRILSKAARQAPCLWHPITRAAL